MSDKSKELFASIKLINDRLNFEGLAEGNRPISIDYTPPLGDNLGYTSLELLLLSLSSCLSTALLTFLRKMGKTITDFKIDSHGIRKEMHPTGFSKINLHIITVSPDVSDLDMKKIIQLSEETYCPVLAMVKGNVDIEITFEVKREA
ncbi:MAG TPA: osmotically inducible protein OsmC [Rikenellaceae bacterium]|nr:osmotically inducible protein OsmC [Rikenellaceae bacterium]